MLLGMVSMHRYRFLTIGQFARITSLSVPHAREYDRPPVVEAQISGLIDSVPAPYSE
jgi:hypothetical protein